MGSGISWPCWPALEGTSTRSMPAPARPPPLGSPRRCHGMCAGCWTGPTPCCGRTTCRCAQCSSPLNRRPHTMARLPMAVPSLQPVRGRSPENLVSGPFGSGEPRKLTPPQPAKRTPNGALVLRIVHEPGHLMWSPLSLPLVAGPSAGSGRSWSACCPPFPRPCGGTCSHLPSPLPEAILQERRRQT